jgi:hypothetical protein
VSLHVRRDAAGGHRLDGGGDVLSGRAGSGDKVDALEAGANDYVTKPFDV